MDDKKQELSNQEQSNPKPSIQEHNDHDQVIIEVAHALRDIVVAFKDLIVALKTKDNQRD